MAGIGQCVFGLGKVSRVDSPGSISNLDALHEQIEIKCFFEGTATLLIGSNTVSVKPGDVVVINPYEFHATVDTGEEKGKYHLFMLPLDYFAGVPELDLHKLVFAEGKRFRTLFEGDGQLHSLLMEVAREHLQGEPASALVTKGLLMAFFALLLRRGLEEGPAPEKTALRRYTVIEPALRRIKHDYPQPLTVDLLARLCNVSKHYFCRSFKSVTGMSAMEYLRDFRLRTADALLRNTDKSIAQIAACCGFESPNYFSRCYKLRYGVPPRRNRTEKTDA